MIWKLLRRGALVAGRLSYANVTATIALFVALGGSAYAVSRIDGHQIKDHSIPVSKLVRGAVVPRAKLSEHTVGLLIPKPRRHRGGKSGDQLATTAQAGQPCATGSVVELSVGQSCVMYSEGPFTITAACSDLGGGDAQASLSATSTENNWWANDSYFPAGTQTIYKHDSTQHVSYLLDVTDLIAPDGTAIQFPRAVALFHEFEDCAFVMDGMG